MYRRLGGKGCRGILDIAFVIVTMRFAVAAAVGAATPIVLKRLRLRRRRRVCHHRQNHCKLF